MTKPIAPSRTPTADTGPTVSVVIPTYNRADLLPRAIRSVRAQTYSNWEIIVVDDASTDRTRDVVHAFADDRVTYVRLDRNSGPSRTRNVGVSRARGSYVTFLDSDDEWLPHRLQVQLQQFEANPNHLGRLGVVLGWRRIQDGRGRVSRLPRTRPTRGDARAAVFGSGSLRRRWNTHWPTMLVRRDALDAVGGFDERLQASEWWDLAARLADAAEFDDVEQPVEIYWQHDGDRAWTADRRIAAARYLLTKHAGRSSWQRRHASHVLLVTGVLELQRNRAGVALRDLARSIALRPGFKALWFLCLAALHRAR